MWWDASCGDQSPLCKSDCSVLHPSPSWMHLSLLPVMASVHSLEPKLISCPLQSTSSDLLCWSSLDVLLYQTSLVLVRCPGVELCNKKMLSVEPSRWLWRSSQTVLPSELAELTEATIVWHPVGFSLVSLEEEIASLIENQCWVLGTLGSMWDFSQQNYYTRQTDTDFRLTQSQSVLE